MCKVISNIVYLLRVLKVKFNLKNCKSEHAKPLKKKEIRD